MGTAEITMTDIRKALSYIEVLPVTRKDYQFGWIEYNSMGPVSIGLNKKTQDELKSLTRFQQDTKIIGEITEYMGIPVVRSD